MTTPSDSLENDPNLSGLGRALLDTGGSKPSGPWVPPTAEELHAILPQYEIVKMLGRGGMGAVYMGRQTALDRPVAIKILSSQLEESDMGFTERFKNEARAMGKLNHPAIVSVYEFGEHESGLLYIVMEYVDGTDVAKMIAAKGRLHTEHAMAITAHVCDALSYAHERGIIHRDIKPANIMVGYDGEVKVADFGLAKVSTSNGSTLGLTQSGMAMGTLHFMAPEALMLGTAVDHRADIYAVGVMLYQMLTGKLPQGMFKMPSLQIAGLDPRYDGVIAKAMMEDRDARYQSAREMRAGLDGILTQPVIKVDPAPAGAAAPAAAALPTQARPHRPTGQPYRPPQPRIAVQTQKRGSLMYWVVVLVLGAAVALMLLDREKQTSPAAAPQETATKTGDPNKTAASDTSSVPAPMPTVAKAPAAPAKPAAAPVTNAYAWLIGTWTQSYGTPPTPALSMELRADYTAEMTAGGKTVQGRWNLSGQKLGINWANGHLHEIIVSTPEAVAELKGKGTPPNGGSFPLLYWKDVPPPAPAAVAAAPKPPASTFTNSLGMKFIDVLGTEVQFCIHETRRRDYAAYASAVPGVDTQWQNPVFENVPLAEGEAHPVSLVSWEEAKAFCDWLSKKEGRRYRLPTDREWSIASGLGDIEPPDLTVANVYSMNTKDVYPWGTVWPPPEGVGNFADTAHAKAYPQKRLLNGYSDGFATTAPVMSFLPNAVGLYDMAGNVQEFCNDLAGWGKTDRLRRGGSFKDWSANSLVSSYRAQITPTTRYELTGFRCVLELGKTATTSNSSLPQPISPIVGMSASVMPAVASATLWVDAKGRSIQAKFVRLESGNVMLNVAGRVQAAALSTLSAASQQIARDLANKLESDMLLQATKDKPFVNSLGMKLVPLPGTSNLICIHETRRADYAKYATENQGISMAWSSQFQLGVPVSPEDSHPVTALNWHEAIKFCSWLSRREGRHYRITSDREWSIAIGIASNEDPNSPIEALSENPKTGGRYVWGTRPRPTNNVGNFADSALHDQMPMEPYIEGFSDGFATTSPVMSFKPNSLGIYDLGGNVWEWCSDRDDAVRDTRILRGSSWGNTENGMSLASFRFMLDASDGRFGGFRVVLELP
jgi:serine/threonine protein kinase/formylglycine-generating enzyme required for sulfatase activity